MKFFILCAGVLFSLSSFACENQEAQFIGKVKSQPHCTFQIEYSMFNSSYVCPLVIGEVSGETFSDASCSLKNGDQISGIMHKIDGVLSIE